MQSKNTDALPSVAPGQYLGYSLQTTRFLMRLLESDPDWTVSLEAFDDVGVEKPDGYKIAEQDKSTLSQNPISNRSKDLWKTFANWIDAISMGYFDPEKTIFEIYVSKRKNGEIAEAFSTAKSIEESEAVLGKAMVMLWGKAPKYKLRSTVSDNISNYVTKVFNAEKHLILTIIKNFSLRFPEISPIQDLKASINKAIIPEELKTDLTLVALGWVKKETDSLIEKGAPAAIQANIFKNAMLAFIRKHDNNTILETYACELSPDQIEKDLNLSIYIRQLDIINIEHDEKIRAVTDNLKASVHRSKWAAKGLVSSDSFDEFEDELLRKWSNAKRKTKVLLGSKSGIDQGQYLYSECISNIAKIDGLEVPAHFTPGSYHTLSNKKALGWHPHYEIILKDNEDNNK